MHKSIIILGPCCFRNLSIMSRKIAFEIFFLSKGLRQRTGSKQRKKIDSMKLKSLLDAYFQWKRYNERLFTMKKDLFFHNDSNVDNLLFILLKLKWVVQILYYEIIVDHHRMFFCDAMNFNSFILCLASAISNAWYRILCADNEDPKRNDCPQNWQTKKRNVNILSSILI